MSQYSDMRIAGLLLVVVVLTVSGSLSQLNITDKEENSKTDFMALRADLFSDFSPDLRPVLNRSQPLFINVSLFVFNVHALDERQQKLTISAWFFLEWMDEFLTWNASNYNGLSELILSKNNVWTPDLKIFNGYEGLLDVADYGNLVRLSSTGEVIFEPGSAFELYCLVDITYYPFDRQQCSIVIMFWMSRISEADMIFSDEDYVFRALRPNGEWDITFLGARHYVKGFSDDPNRKYAYLEYTFRLERKRTFYVLHFLIPVTLLSLLNAIVFILPPESGEKMSLSITVLLSFTLFISLLNSSLPQTSLHVSVFAVYLSILLGLGTISVVFSAIGLYLHYRIEDAQEKKGEARHVGSLRRRSAKRRSGRQSLLMNEEGDRVIEYNGLLLTTGEKQRITDRRNNFLISFPQESSQDDDELNSKHIRSETVMESLPEKPTRQKSAPSWCRNPRLFDHIGFCVSLFMTIGSTFTAIMLLTTH